jgi:tetratricopeptide (TPR) repeat protein
VGWAWKSLGFTAWDSGQPALAEEYFRRGLQVAEEIGDQERASECWRGLAYAAADLRDFDRAEECLWRSLASAESIGSPWQLARTWLGLAHLSRECGRPSEGIERLRRSLAFFEPLTDPKGLVLPRVSLGWCLWRQGDLTEAEECLRQAAVAREGTPWTDNITRVYLGLGGVLRDRGDHAGALRWLRQARHGTHRGGFLLLEVEATVEQGRAHLRAGQRRATTAALAMARRLASADGAAQALAHLHLLEAELHLHDGRLAEARTAAQEALRRAIADEARRVERLSVVAFSQGRPLQGLAQRLLGECALAQGDAAEAEAHLRAALALQLELGAALEAARTRLLLAEALVEAAGHSPVPAEALTLLGEARVQFATSGAAPDVARAEHLSAAWTGRGT